MADYYNPERLAQKLGIAEDVPKVPTAINMQRLQADQTEAAGEDADKVTPRQVGAGMAS